MTLKVQTGQHPAGLDVIVEEEISQLIEDLDIPPKSHLQYNAVVSTSTTCTFTLRKYTYPTDNQPQFLHTGQWPRTSLIDCSLVVIADQEDDVHLTTSSVTYGCPLSAGPDEKMLTTPDVCTQAFITADQLSMVMDCWDPDEDGIPIFSIGKNEVGVTSITIPATYPHMILPQQSLFVREIMDEHVTRLQTVEYIEELEDNDNAIEVVAVLESYRQNGWADEMIKAFPRECWSFWARSGLTEMASSENDIADEGDHTRTRND